MKFEVGDIIADHITLWLVVEIYDSGYDLIDLTTPYLESHTIDFRWVDDYELLTDMFRPL